MSPRDTNRAPAPMPPIALPPSSSAFSHADGAGAHSHLSMHQRLLLARGECALSRAFVLLIVLLPPAVLGVLALLDWARSI